MENDQELARQRCRVLQGKIAFCNGIPHDTVPAGFSALDRKSWQRGWMDEGEKIAAQIMRQKKEKGKKFMSISGVAGLFVGIGMIGCGGILIIMGVVFYLAHLGLVK